MSKIKQRSDWGYWDELDGVVLKTGEKLVVTYPDGTEELVAVQISDRSFQSQDMGHPFTCANDVAFAEFDFKGARVKLELRGLEARRV